MVSPDRWGYGGLANTYKAQGDIDRWKKTLDEYLSKVEDLGLEHAQARVEIADYYAGLKQWDNARPYAEAAATTGAGWAMECAGRCAEGENDWERAETWFSRVTERYPDHSPEAWYFFCKRTGHGNVAAAREKVESYLTEHAKRPDVQIDEYGGCFYWLDGRLDQAKASLARAYQTRTSISAALALAMIADGEKHRPARRADLRASDQTQGQGADVACDLPDPRQQALRRGRQAQSARRRRGRQGAHGDAGGEPRQRRVFRRLVPQE